eukprot:Anaeramoba_ignava/a622319_8.p1 GENE.a622319_8~~a622319_8.p1  ORF type:complete len:206 (-),score=55.03 a622319_8:113-730(-)
MNPLSSFTQFFDFQKPSIWKSIMTIFLAPTLWNIISRFEYKTRILTKIFRSNERACYAFFVFVFSFSSYRDFLFYRAVGDQMKLDQYSSTSITTLGTILMTTGFILVVAASSALGIIGTYCGDYFGLYFDEKITSFPFNILEHPMYFGSTSIFFGYSIYMRSPAGLLLSCIVYVCYFIASHFFEGPFTDLIYKQKDEKMKKKVDF